MKRIIQIVGIICLGIVIAINLIYASYLNISEEIITGYNSVIFTIEVILIGIMLYLIANMLDDLLYKEEKKESATKRRVIYGILITIYIAVTICWTIFIRPGIVADQVHVAGLARSFVRGDTEEYLTENSYAGNSLKEYFEGYSQQIPLAFVQSLFFRLMNNSEIESLRALNVVRCSLNNMGYL